MDSSPVTIISTIYPLSGVDLLLPRMRMYIGNLSTNAKWGKLFVSAEYQKELDIAGIVISKRA
jgi:hypothetical protein